MKCKTCGRSVEHRRKPLGQWVGVATAIVVNAVTPGSVNRAGQVGLEAGKAVERNVGGDGWYCEKCGLTEAEFTRWWWPW